MRYRLVILDFDGTLADSLPIFGELLAEAAGRFGFRRPAPEELETLRGLDARAIMASLGVPLWKVPAIAGHMRARMAEQAGRLRPFPGIPEALAGLAEAGVPLAIASSNAEGTIRHCLGAAAAEIGLWECGASLFGKGWRLRRLLARGDTPAAAAILVGDELRDAVAAREAGIAFGAVAWGYNRPDALAAAAPAEWFATPADLHRLAEQTNA
ncbi:HAD hydrolase-like protein [Roseomonas sp. NAR14]|uniref:HAD hydrolase-like protein n=1 Tax=Roseomonas acroporae TaxID=2937791 RepID=A0A9X1YA55_9PROT|nr:HAD hydrolase-like protein [Roseomonas acroporae]MCK8786949.1 HAD hydrolase-like protein [Roseomonas acroporae]